MVPKNEPAEERILVLTPTGRDAEITCEVLRNDGLACEPCADLDEVLQEVSSGAAAVLVADEALTSRGTELLGAALEQQEAWSDLPILIATTEAGSRGAHERLRRHLGRAGSITILERPIPTVTLLTAVRSALTARQRQYQLRGLLAELHAKTQWLEEERELRERFVAILAHDLRGPLSTIAFTIDLLARESVSPDRRRDLAVRTARNVVHLDRMIHDLLDIHRIRAGGRLPLRLDRCDLTKLVRDVAEDLRGTYGDRFVVRGNESIDGIWSPDDLRRAVWNLATNAIKYGAPDTPVGIAVESGQEGVRVSVHNQGAPIPPEDQEALFEPFSRTPASETGNEGGWGLGLALVRACAESHGGAVDVESVPGRGTTFTMRLPRDARPYQPSSAPDLGRRDQAQPH